MKTAKQIFYSNMVIFSDSEEEFERTGKNMFYSFLQRDDPQEIYNLIKASKRSKNVPDSVQEHLSSFEKYSTGIKNDIFTSMKPFVDGI